MSYKPLKITFYENRNKFEEEYQLRFNFFSTFKTGLNIHPFDRQQRITTESYELFYIPLLEHENLKEKIQKIHQKLKDILVCFPQLSREIFLILKLLMK